MASLIHFDGEKSERQGGPLEVGRVLEQGAWALQGRFLGLKSVPHGSRRGDDKHEFCQGASGALRRQLTLGS